jgi:tRNA 2-thiouridine synthesizing protein D
MNYSIAVFTPPSANSSYHAFKFAQSVVNRGHTLTRVFFYGDGVYNANSLQAPPQDETNMVERWRTLAAQTDLCVCIAAGIRRGVLDAQEASRHKLHSGNLAEGFSIAGLGQWVEAVAKSDRVITFG